MRNVGLLHVPSGTLESWAHFSFIRLPLCLGLPLKTTQKLQLVQNVAAHLQSGQADGNICHLLQKTTGEEIYFECYSVNRILIFRMRLIMKESVKAAGATRVISWPQMLDKLKKAQSLWDDIQV